MPTPVYTSPFTGTVVTPTDVSYYALPFSSNTQLYWPAVANGSQVPAARIIDCVASTGGLSIFLPPANQGTVGTDILFRNLGGNSFVVVNASGGSSISVPAGMAIYVYLVDNGTVNGIWESITFGAGTSYADASRLAGLGLTALNGVLNTTQNLVDVTSTPVINDGSRAATFVWNGGAGTFTLPAISSLSVGWYIGFRNNGTGALTINPTSPTLINNSVGITAYPGDSGFIFFDESGLGSFITVGFTAPSNVTFTAETFDVDAIVGNSLSLVSFAPIIQTYVAQSDIRTETLTVTLPAITQIYILVNATSHTDYDINFTIAGSSNPPLVLTAGAVATVLSDGSSLFPLTTGSTGFFFAANGAAVTPAFSFNNDTSTGMYLVGTGVLGLAANGTNLVSIDGSNLSQPLVTVNATLNAQLIASGTF